MGTHDSWARYYDYVYEVSYGDFYKHFTDNTVRTIQSILPRGSITDLGAGTGRLSIPLADLGYEVRAIERSAGMIRELQNKLGTEPALITIVHEDICEADFGSPNLILSLFTVLSYITDESALKRTIERIASSLQHGGFFFFDLPAKAFFHSGILMDYQHQDLTRKIQIKSSLKPERYSYHEVTSGTYEGLPFSYEDTFTIRYWDPEQVCDLLCRAGMRKEVFDLSQFSSTGSHYFLYKKE